MTRAVALLFTFLLCAGSALAQSGDADKLFKMARDASKRGDHATACRLFKESHALDPALGTLHNIARCEEEQGHLASAVQRYREVVAQAPAGSERAEYATKRLAWLEPKVPTLRLRLASDDASLGASVSVDGRLLASAELSLASSLDPGKHVVEVRRKDGVARTYDVTLNEAEHRELEIAAVPHTEPAPNVEPRASPTAVAVPPPAHQPTPPDRDTRPKGRDTTLGWVVLGAGAGALALSGVAALFVLDRKATVEKDCDANLVCKSQAGKDAADSGQTWSTIGTIAFVAGAVGVGAGTYLLVSAEPAKKSAFISASATF
ncbi:MAG: tetratricopeptide repeat protein [Polyangiaceae bacterium]